VNTVEIRAALLNMEVPEEIWLAAKEYLSGIYKDRLAFSIIRQLHLKHP
jgi:hypothetical protein